MTDGNGAPGGTTAITSERFHNRGTAFTHEQRVANLRAAAAWQRSCEEPCRTG